MFTSTVRYSFTLSVNNTTVNKINTNRHKKSENNSSVPLSDS